MRVIIGDDEALARQYLRTVLADFPGVEVVAEAEEGDQALEFALIHKPDLLLLDIDMPGQSGLSAALELGEGLTDVVFVTAHEQHALRAFELGAVDYLLKPISRARLSQALSRVNQRYSARQQLDQTVSVMPQQSTSSTEHVFWVPVRKGVVRVAVDDIERVEAARDLVYFHTKDHSYIYRITMTELERQLVDSGLLRVHRSFFLRPERVKRIKRAGRLISLQLEDGTLVPVGPSYRTAAIAAIQASVIG